MRRVVRLRPVRANGLPGPESSNSFDEYVRPQSLAGYTLEQLLMASPGRGTVWRYVVVMAASVDEPEVHMGRFMQPSPPGPYPLPWHLRPVGRLVRTEAPHSERRAAITPPTSKATTPPTIHTLRPVRSGRAYATTSPPTHSLVRPKLAEALETVFERFARERGFAPEKPLEIRFTRGFQAGSHGHGDGRAADIAAVAGKSLLAWKQEWDQTVAAAEKLLDERQPAEAISAEQQRNLGYGLYKALQEHGGWRVNQQGWRPYRGIMQLFGPWTATEGPWKTLQIKDPNPHQRQRLADQQWVFRAHQDHIHVAR
jgi:hypothetical protein